MLHSCSYCGKIHEKRFDCGKKPKKNKRGNDKDRFRWTKAWQDKREEIKERDKYLCQVCIRNLYNTLNCFTYGNIGVHHAIPLEEDFEKRLDNDSLITICDYHHELAESREIPRKVILDIIKEQEYPPRVSTSK